jgi:hypothetical protein
MEASKQLDAPAVLPRRKQSLYPLDRMLGGHQSLSGRCRGKKKSLLPLEIEPRFPGLPARSLIIMLGYLIMCTCGTFI